MLAVVALLVSACDATPKLSTPVPPTPGPGQTDTAYATAPTHSFEPDGALEAELRAAGMPAELAGRYSAVTTEVTSSAPGHYRYEQRLPAQGLLRDVEMRFTQMTLTVPGDVVPLVTTRGIHIYPLLLSAEPIEGGYLLQTMFYIPPGELTDDELAALAPQPATALGAGTARLIASLAGVAAPGAGGVLVQSGIGVADTAAPGSGGSGGLGNTLIQSQPSQASSNLGFWDNIDAMDDYYNNLQDTQQFVRENDFANRGIAWRENELRIAREAAAEARLNNVAAGGVALWEAYNAVRDWWSADDELTALDDCNRNTTNPLQRDQSEIDAATERIGDVRNELRINNTIRGVNILTNFFAARIPGPVGVAAQVLSSGNDAMLHEDQGHIMSGLSTSIAPCNPTYLKVQVRYRFSLSFVNDPPQRGRTNDRGMVNDLYSATIVVPLQNGQFQPNGGWGTFRHAESGGYDCVEYSYLTTGAAAAHVSGGQDGFVRPDPEEPPTPTYLVSVAVRGQGLVTMDDVLGFDHQGDDGNPVCTQHPNATSQDGSASLNCSFPGVDVLHGGAYQDPTGYATSDLGETESVTCHLVVTPLVAPPPQDPTAPAPPQPE